MNMDDTVTYADKYGCSLLWGEKPRQVTNISSK